MAFTLACPKCGCLNTTPKFNPFSKTITCVQCGEEIDIKQSRLISKRCECGQVVVFDQKKSKTQKCPSCGRIIGYENSSAQFRLKRISCPQCYCEIDIHRDLDVDRCPVCGKVIIVKEVLAKENLVSDSGVSVLKYEGDNQTFVWKHPIEDFNMGSQLIVHESQEAIFFLNGQMLDTFGPGRYTLETESMPVLKTVYNLPTGDKTPFHAEVYFINKTVEMGMKWGTDTKIHFTDPVSGIALELGAHGSIITHVENGREVLLKLVGTSNKLSFSDLILTSGTANTMPKALGGFFRPMIMTCVKSHLGAAIREKAINILEIDSYLEELSTLLKDKIAEIFREYGFGIKDFLISGIELPEDDPNFQTIKALIAEKYINVQHSKNELELKKLQVEHRKAEAEAEAEALKIKAAAESEAMKMKAGAALNIREEKGMVDARVMQAQGYSQQDLIRADVQKEMARGIGNMGGGNGGGGIASELLAATVGLQAVGGIADTVGKTMNGIAQAAESTGWSCSCGHTGNTGKFCAECGSPKPQAWDCSCGAKGNTGKFCAECGKPKPEYWVCPSCGKTENVGKFCPECGTTKPVAASETWDCSCGNKHITGKFCPECGNKRGGNEE